MLFFASRGTDRHRRNAADNFFRKTSDGNIIPLGFKITNYVLSDKLYIR